MAEALRSVLPGTAGLTGAAMVALPVTVACGGVEADDARLRSVVRLALAAVAYGRAQSAVTPVRGASFWDGPAQTDVSRGVSRVIRNPQAVSADSDDSA